jgi:ABC-type multidrug transport system fused ATPase/permease subunit
MNLSLFEIWKFQRKILRESVYSQIIISAILASLDVLQIFILAIIFSSKRSFNFFDQVIEVNDYLLEEDLFIAATLALIFKYGISFLVIKRSYILNFNFQRMLTNRLLTAQYNKPLARLANEDARKVLKLCQKDADEVCYQIFNQLIFIYLDIFVFAGLIIALIIISPINTIFFILVILVYFLLSYKIRGNLLNKVLERKNEYEAQKFDVLSEAIKNSIQAKYFKSEDYFQNKLNGVTEKLSFISIKEYLIRDSEKYLFEFLLILALIYIALNSKDSYDATFFLIATLKIGMSFLKLLNYFNQLKQNHIKLSGIKKALLRPVYNTTNLKHLTQIDRLKYDGLINFDIKDNGIYLLKGKSGSGKTSIINELIGFKNNINSTISINDSASTLSGSIAGLCSQDKNILIDTVKNNITYGKSLNKIKFEKSLQFSALDKFDVNRYLDLGIASVSGGEAQRICLARAFYHNESNVYILDEPLTGLDPEIIKVIVQNIIDLSKYNIIFMIAHDNFFDEHAKLICRT